MSYTNPYSNNHQPMMQNAIPQQYTTIDDNSESIRQMIEEEQERSCIKYCKWACTIYWVFQAGSLIIFVIIYSHK